MDEKQVAKHFDRMASWYVQSYQDGSVDAYFFTTRQSLICSFLPDLVDGRLLDAGCGPGMMVDLCVNRNIEFVGVDISMGMITACKDRFAEKDHAHFVVSSIQNLCFPDGYFDIVLCMGALEYVDNVEGTLAEFRRVLKPSGLLIVSCLNQISPYWLWDRLVYQKMINVLKPLKGQKTHGVSLRLFKEKDFCQLLISLRMKIINSRYYDFNLMLPPLDNKLPKLSVQISKRLEPLYRSRLKVLGRAFLVLACAAD